MNKINFMNIKIIAVLFFFWLFASLSNAQLIQYDGLVLDKGGTCNGTMNPGQTWGLKFGGPGVGQGILSTKSVGTNISGLDFTTKFLNRLRILNNGNIGIGRYATHSTRVSFGTNSVSPASKLHVQLGNIQVTNSGAPTSPRTTKTGLTLGAAGAGTTSLENTDYYWVQSSNEPRLLNPLSGNTLSGAQTNNYVAIGLRKDNIIDTVANGITYWLEEKYYAKN